jgi:hypothetical protein
LIDPRFPHNRVALYADTTHVAVQPIRAGQQVPPSGVHASIEEWEPGRMRIALAGVDPNPTFLLVSETWYPDWHATVDGKPAAVHRGDYAFLSVALPPGAREVRLEFASPDYRRGRTITWLALLVTVGLLVGPAACSRLRRPRG